MFEFFKVTAEKTNAWGKMHKNKIKFIPDSYILSPKVV